MTNIQLMYMYWNTFKFITQALTKGIIPELNIDDQLLQTHSQAMVTVVQGHVDVEIPTEDRRVTHTAGDTGTVGRNITAHVCQGRKGGVVYILQAVCNVLEIVYNDTGKDCNKNIACWKVSERGILHVLECSL